MNLNDHFIVFDIPHRLWGGVRPSGHVAEQLAQSPIGILPPKFFDLSQHFGDSFGVSHDLIPDDLVSVTGNREFFAAVTNRPVAEFR